MKIKIPFLIILIIFIGIFAYANINIDGDFSDWIDKPLYEAEPIEEDSAMPEQEINEVELPQEPIVELPQEPVIDAPPEEQPIEVIPQENNEQLETEGEVIPEEMNLLKEDVKGGPKFKIHQLQWHLYDEDQALYISARLSHPEDIKTGSITTHLVTDFGIFDIISSYDTEDGTVLSLLNGQPVENSTGICEVINKNTVSIEYGIPIDLLIEDMKWGYLIQFKVLTEDDEEPKGDYITISTASTMPYLGVGVCVALGIGIPYFMKRKKKQ